MEKLQQSKSATALCIVGLPDNSEVTVSGYNEQGKLGYIWDGNSDFHNQLAVEGLSKEYLPIVWHNNPARNIGKPDLIINNINDPDIASKSLAIAIETAEAINAKWPEVKIFNHPAKIADTARNRIYELYKDVQGLHIPKAIKIQPTSVTDVLEKAKGEFNFPFLIRPAGAHQSQGLQLIYENTAAQQLERYPYDERSYYLTEYVDYKSAQGLYHKCRLVIIDGQILPRHYMTGTDWLVHGNLHEEYMADNDLAKFREENFINDYSSIIKPQQLDALMEIYNRSGLDYLGFDFAIKEDESLLIFEINAAQNSFLTLDFKVFPYMKQTRENLISAFNSCIMRKCA